MGPEAMNGLAHRRADRRHRRAEHGAEWVAAAEDGVRPLLAGRGSGNDGIRTTAPLPSDHVASRIESPCMRVVGARTGR